MLSMIRRALSFLALPIAALIIAACGGPSNTQANHSGSEPSYYTSTSTTTSPTPTSPATTTPTVPTTTIPSQPPVSLPNVNTRPALQHLPYVANGVTISVYGGNSSGKVILLVSCAKACSLSSAQAVYANFLAKYGDSGAGYQPDYQLNRPVAPATATTG